MAKKRGTKRKKKKYRIKKRFWILLILLMICILGMTKCTLWLMEPYDDLLGLNDGIRRSAIGSTEEWKLVLVNKTHKLPEDHKVKTVPMTGYSSYEFDARAIASLEAMINDAAAEGLDIEVCSAHRTIEYQKNLIEEQVAKYMGQGMSLADAEARTATEIIEPGASEHHLGLAVDLVAKSYQHLEPEQADTAENQWLQAHCTEYGFILRYPEGKQDITGIIYEPWHFRYVGEAAAEEIMSQGICLEEYLGML